MLLNPTRAGDRNCAVANLIDPNRRRRCSQNEWQLLQLFQSDPLRIDKISLRCKAQREFEAALIIARKVYDAAFEDGRIGNANVVAIKAQQDRRARGQTNDFACVATDFDCVIRAKRLTDGEHDGGDEVLYCVFDRKTDG